MRCTVYTATSYLELGATAKDNFLKCFPFDENGHYDTVQTMTEEAKNNIKKLTDNDYGMSWDKKSSYAKKSFAVMDKVPLGSKILVTNDWSGQQHMMEAVKMMNDGKTVNEINKIFTKRNEEVALQRKKDNIDTQQHQ